MPSCSVRRHDGPEQRSDGTTVAKMVLRPLTLAIGDVVPGLCPASSNGPITESLAVVRIISEVRRSTC